MTTGPRVQRQPPWAALTPSTPAVRHLLGLRGTGNLSASLADRPPQVPPHGESPAEHSPVGSLTANIADDFDDLLTPLSRQRRLGLIAQMSVGFYDGWRPSRDEIADLVAVEVGMLTVEDHLERQRCRTRERLVRAVRRALVAGELDRPGSGG